MDEDILKALAEAGDKGLSLQKIIIYAYNCQNSLFLKYERNEVRRYVIRYLRKNTKYRLNPNSDKKSQLLLSFEEEQQECEPVAPTVDGITKRTLFDDLV